MLFFVVCLLGIDGVGWFFWGVDGSIQIYDCLCKIVGMGFWGQVGYQSFNCWFGFWKWCFDQGQLCKYVFDIVIDNCGKVIKGNCGNCSSGIGVDVWQF